MRLTPTPPRGAAAVAAVLAALTLVFVDAADDGPRKTNIVERAESILVEIPLHVTLDGEPVRELSPDQFEIFDRGDRQELAGFSVVDLRITAAGGPAPRPTSDVSLAARRHFLLLFDLSFSDANAIRSAQSTMRDWARNQLHPWDLVGVAVYSARTGAQLLLNFTSDREQLALAIESLGLPQYVHRGQDPLALEIGVGLPGVSPLDPEDPGIRAGGGTTSSVANDREGDAIAALRAIYYSVYEPVNKQAQVHDVLALTRSIELLAERVRAVRGRKHVIFLSQGFEGSIVYAEDDREEIQRLNTAVERGALQEANNSSRFGNNAAMNSITQMIDELRRADCVVQAVQIGAASGNETLSSSRAEGLFAMADGTGGELYRDYNDLDDAMSSLLEKTSVTYLLSFRPTDFREDGRFHKLKVKVRDLPRRAQVTHRPGYYEPKAGEKLTPEQLRMQAASRIMEGRDGDGTLSSSLLASAFRDGESSYVPVLIEIDGASLPRETDDAELSLDVYLYAVGEGGDIADFFTQRLTVDLRTFGDKLLDGGLKLFGDLELAPGEYSLRLLVRENRFGLYSTRAATLRAPEYGPGQPTLLPPFFPDPRGKWLLVREERAPDATDERPFPFMREDGPYIPAARPVVASHGEAEVLLVTYGLGDGPVSVYTEVIDLLGAAHDEPRIRVVDRHVGNEAQDLLTARFQARGLPAGDYTLLVTVANDRTGKAQTNSIPIRIVEETRQTESVGGGAR